jgi:hypothetical protein
VPERARVFLGGCERLRDFPIAREKEFRRLLRPRLRALGAPHDARLQHAVRERETLERFPALRPFLREQSRAPELDVEILANHIRVVKNGAVFGLERWYATYGIHPEHVGIHLHWRNERVDGLDAVS